jgi:hypothetical protein
MPGTYGNLMEGHSMFDLATRIPARVRGWIYTIAGAVITVESTLDTFDYGLIPAKPTAAAVAVLAALGFTIARSNTPTKEG